MKTVFSPEEVERLLKQLSAELGVKVRLSKGPTPLHYDPFSDEVRANPRLIAEVLSRVSQTKGVSLDLRERLRSDLRHESEHRRLLRLHQVLVRARLANLHFTWGCAEALQDYLIEFRILRQEVVITDYLSCAKSYLVGADRRLSDFLTAVGNANVMLMPYFLLAIALSEGALTSSQLSDLKAPERELVFKIVNLIEKLSEQNLVSSVIGLEKAFSAFLVKIRGLITFDVSEMIAKLSGEMERFQRLISS